MNVTLYTNSSPDNAISKTLAQISSNEFVFKESSSILNPVIRLSGLNVADLKDCNYMYIGDLSRYYYITNIQTVRNNLVEVSGRVDPLMSFKDEILSNTAIISRNEKAWNLFINDGVLKTYQNPQIATSNFTTGFTKSNPSIVLAVAGGGTSS